MTMPDASGTPVPPNFMQPGNAPVSQVPPPLQTPPPMIPAPAPRYKLYDSSAIALATFLGFLIGGPLLMAVNYFRLRKAAAGIITLVCGLVTALLAYIVTYAVKSGTFSMMVAVGCMYAMSAIAKKLQGPAIKHHEEAGGKWASKAPVALIGGGLTLLATIAAIYLLFVQSSVGTRVSFDKDDVYYAGTATEADAKALYASLRNVGCVNDKGADIHLRKDANGTTLAFIPNGDCNDPKTIAYITAVTRAVASSVGGLPITVDLLDQYLKVKKEFKVDAVAAPTAPSAQAAPATPSAAPATPGASSAQPASPAPQAPSDTPSESAIQRALRGSTQPTNPLDTPAPVNPLSQ